MTSHYRELVNRSIDLFVYDEEFAKKIMDYDNLEESALNINTRKRFYGFTKT